MRVRVHVCVRTVKCAMFSCQVGQIRYSCRRHNRWGIMDVDTIEGASVCTHVLVIRIDRVMNRFFGGRMGAEENLGGCQGDVVVSAVDVGGEGQSENQCSDKRI